MSTRDWAAEVERDGLFIRDEIFTPPVFEEFDRAVRCSWEQSTGWHTRIKGPGAARAIPLQGTAQTAQIGALLKAHEAAHPAEFTYLYHSLHESRDQSGIIRTIGDALITEWRECIEDLVDPPFRTNFSLTAYTPHCQLTSHTDHAVGHEPYRLTLLFYLSGSGAGLAPLHFEFNGKRKVIQALPNRSVMFVPSTATNHWIEPVVSTDPRALRLAFSGWLI